MTRSKLAFAFVLAILVTIIPGAIHGRLSGRWGVPEGLVAAEKLETFPDEFADWKLDTSSDLPDYALNSLECFGYINRMYTHQSTGQVVNALVLIGPCKPTAEHTPGVCYSRRSHTIIQPPLETSIPIEGHDSDEFWTMTFRSTDLDGGGQRVYYAWSDGQHWRADKEPQYAYPGRPYLYKIQVAANAPPNTNFDKEDLVRSFLIDFLPVLQDYLVPQPD